MDRRRRNFLVIFLLSLVTLSTALWFFALTTPASRELGKLARSWHALVQPEGPAAILSAEVTLLEAAGLPDALVGRTAGITYQYPDRLRISVVVDGDPYAAARNGQEVWLHAPAKNMAIVGSADVPLFASRPDSVEPIAFDPFSIPGSQAQLRLFPALVHAHLDEATNTIRFTFKEFAQRLFDLPEHSFAVRFEPRSLAPVSLGMARGDGTDISLGFSDFEVLPAEEGRFAIPAEDSERVALSHLSRFVTATIAHMGAVVPALPEATGGKTVVAASGDGRLEDHDGTRVLFLRGTPEQMGAQHGELLGPEVRSVVERILYGVGVGSSFDQGRWFFGEIEEAFARLEPHISPDRLLEMDALAEAAGLEREEVRLANVFPALFHCSGFALHDSATADGALYHGRVLDYLRGAGLEENAVVIVCQPTGKNAWVNVGYAGFIGSVTAMNEHGLAIGEMGGGGRGEWDGVPMPELMRRVMEEASTIEEAVSLMRESPRTCEYYYVISDAKDHRAVGISATPDTFETVWSGGTHEKLPVAVPDAVLLSAGARYDELVRRVREGHGTFTPESARALMARGVAMGSNIQSVLFAPDTLDFWVANADSEHIASEARYTRYNLRELLQAETRP